MKIPVRSRNAIALMLLAVALVASVQAAAITPIFASVDRSDDNSVTVQLLPSPTGTESLSARGSVEVDPEDSQVTIQLEHVRANSIYTVLLVSGSGNLQLGALSTNDEGEGTLQTSIGAGTYVGIFEVTRLGAVQLVSGTVSFTIGLSGSISTATSHSSMTTLSQTSSSSVTSTSTATTQTSISSSQTLTQTTGTATTITASNTLNVEFQVEPPSRSISAGAFAIFHLKIKFQEHSFAPVMLVARGLPEHSVAFFNSKFGIAHPEFNSMLTVLTSADTPGGSYTITVVAIVKEQEVDTQVNLQVAAPSNSITFTTSNTISIAAGVSVALETDAQNYRANATVNIQGHVTDLSGNAIGGATVSLQVDGPKGRQIAFVRDITTDASGVFRFRFTLPSNANAGTYWVFASVNVSGQASETTSTTFVVGASPTPSIMIRAVNVTDTSGNLATTFSAGQSVLVWVVVQNDGASIQGVIWMYIRDPNGAPVSTQLQITTLATGATVKVAFGFTTQSNSARGLYSANALVSDKLISQGGAFLASSNAQFALRG